MKRYLYLIIGSISMCIYGLMFNWTVFSPVVQNDLNITTSMASTVFMLAQVFFGIGQVANGFVYTSKKHKRQMIVASLVIFFGLFISSKAFNIYMIYLGYSLLFSFSAGFCYKGVLTVVLSWFQDKSGFASGVLVTGAGLTAFVFNVPVSILIEFLGWRQTMLGLSILAFVISMMATLFVKTKEIKEQEKEMIEDAENDVPTPQMMKKQSFILYFIWSTIVLAGASSISGTSVNCAMSFGLTATMAASYSMIISLFNAGSRTVFGLLFDKLGYEISIKIGTCLYVGGVFVFYIALSQHIQFLLAISYVLIGLSFGSVCSISPAYILKKFGKKYYPSNFSIQSSYALLSPFVGTMIFSLLLSLSHSYMISYSYLVVYAVLSLVCNRWLVKFDKK